MIHDENHLKRTANILIGGKLYLHKRRAASARGGDRQGARCQKRIAPGSVHLGSVYVSIGQRRLINTSNQKLYCNLYCVNSIHAFILRRPCPRVASAPQHCHLNKGNGSVHDAVKWEVSGKTMDGTSFRFSCC